MYENERIIGLVQPYFAGIKYLEIYPDVACAIRDGAFTYPIEHYLRYGIFEHRKFCALDDVDLPLYIVAFHLMSGDTDNARIIFLSFLAKLRGDLNSFECFEKYDRFDIYGELLAHEFSLFSEIQFPNAAIDHELTYDDFIQLLYLFTNLQNRILDKKNVIFIQKILYLLPELIMNEFFEIVFYSSDRSSLDDSDFIILFHSILTRKAYKALKGLLVRNRHCEHNLHEDHLRLVANLYYGNNLNNILTYSTTKNHDPFTCLLLAISHLEHIESTSFTIRGHICKTNFATLSLLSEILRPYLGQSTICNYIEGRVAHLMGYYKIAISFFDKAMSITPSFNHGISSAGEAYTHDGNIQDALNTTVKLFDITYAREPLIQASYLKHWLNKPTEIKVSYTDKIDDLTLDNTIISKTDYITDLATHRLETIFRGAALADHNFKIDVSLNLFDFISNYIIFSNAMPFILEISHEDSIIYFRVGNGHIWLHNILILSKPSKDPINLSIVRLNFEILIILNGKPHSIINVDTDFWFRGETYIFHLDPNPNAHQNFIGGANIKIEKYHTGSNHKNLRILSIFWGKEYLQMFNQTLIPSLLYLSDLPTISKSYYTTFEVITTSDAYYCVKRQLDLLKKQYGIEYELNVDILSADATNNAKLLHKVLPHVWERHEKLGSITLMAQPDHVFGKGLINVLNMNTANKYTVCGHPRVDSVKGFKFISQILKNRTVTNNAGLVKAGPILHPHTTFAKGLNSKEHWLKAKKNRNYFEVYFKEPPPLCLRVRKDLLSILTGNPYGYYFEQIDHDIVDLVYKQDRLNIIDDSNDFFWLEFSGNEKNYPTIRNSYFTSAARMLSKRKLIWHF